MLTWDEAKAAVNKAQSTSREDFERHLADYMVQGIVDKLIDDYLSITMRRMTEAGYDVTDTTVIDAVSHEVAIFMTGVQVGWYLGHAE